ncbi:N-acetyl glucosamine/N-acetyl galactosamine epimerase [Aeromonas hydrophila]|nr:N-acetyl glucosamine/N-acetyl galactosamine epimerase [Aeromonas hydrophila]
MCPCDDSYHTFEFDDFFIIGPTINFNNRNNDFSVTASGEKGTMVAQGFEYNSRDNDDFLTVEQLKALNSKVVME